MAPPKLPKLVPNDPVGASRRAYMHGYSKSASDKVNDLLGKRKLRTPASKQARVPKDVKLEDPAGQGSGGRRDYSKSSLPDDLDFGATGFNDPLFHDPTD